MRAQNYSIFATNMSIKICFDLNFFFVELKIVIELMKRSFIIRLKKNQFLESNISPIKYNVSQIVFFGNWNDRIFF